MKCSVYCHATEFERHNLSQLAIRTSTEVALVDRGTEEDGQLQEDSRKILSYPVFADSNDLPPRGRKRTRQTTPTTIPDCVVEGGDLRKRRRRLLLSRDRSHRIQLSVGSEE